jgi:phosphoglycerate kinase
MNQTTIDHFFKSNHKRLPILIVADLNINSTSYELITKHPRFTCLETLIQKSLFYQTPLIIASHKGRPNGVDQSYSLKHLQAIFGKHYQTSVTFDTTYHIEQRSINYSTPLTILENHRFYETKLNQSQERVDYFKNTIHAIINESFPTSHRDSFFNTTLPKTVLNKCIGPIFETEISRVQQFRTKNPSSFLIIGGNKLASKLPFIHQLPMTISGIFFGGKIALDIIKHQRCNHPNEPVSDLLEYTRSKNINIHLPVDFVTNDTKNTSTNKVVNTNKINIDTEAYDIGPNTIANFETIMRDAKGIILNGPMGKVEEERFQSGTSNLIHYLELHHSTRTMIGGGETNILLRNSNAPFFHISTAGGAFLALLCDNKLPGYLSFT